MMNCGRYPSFQPQEIYDLYEVLRRQSEIVSRRMWRRFLVKHLTLEPQNHFLTLENTSEYEDLVEESGIPRNTKQTSVRADAWVCAAMKVETKVTWSLPDQYS
jgi:hypothetical protein